jgi:hypothetical protein
MTSSLFSGDSISAESLAQFVSLHMNDLTFVGTVFQSIDHKKQVVSRLFDQFISNQYVEKNGYTSELCNALCTLRLLLREREGMENFVNTDTAYLVSSIAGLVKNESINNENVFRECCRGTKKIHSSHS